jgi:ABC-type lipoprotein release transport system permease subunit
MNTVLRIALGNIWANRSKMFLLASLIILGVAINILANGFLTATKDGTEYDFRANYSGDIIVHGVSQYPVSLFAVQKPVVSQSLDPLPELADAAAVRNIVSAQNEVRDFTTLITGMGFLTTADGELEYENSGGMDMVDLVAYTFSGDANTYWKMFPNYKITEGKYPETGEPATAEIAISETTRKAFSDYYKQPLNVGDTLTLQAISDTINIRELTVSGFYNIEGAAAPVLLPSFIDNDTARSLAGLNRGSDWITDFELPFDMTNVDLSEDDIFAGADDMVTVTEPDADIFGESAFDINTESIKPALRVNPALRDSGAGAPHPPSLTQPESINPALQAWNFMLIKLKNSGDSEKVIGHFNAEFEALGIGAKAEGWNVAAADFTSTTNTLVILFSVFMAIIGVVVLIVKMNLLLVSIMGRVPDIGMMRAIGA